MDRNGEGTFEGVSVFVAVVEAGTFTAAADRLGHSVSFISKAVTRLEARIGVRLLNRTTRTLSLTDAGRLYFERCRQIVADAQAAERCVTLGQETPRGLLRLSAPVSFGLGYLRHTLPDFLAAYPDVTMEIESNDRFVDVVAEGYDVVIRVADLKDSNLVSRRITSSRGLTVAAPAYWDRRGRPTHPADLTDHNCISYTYKQAPNHWEFHDPAGGRIGVNITPRVLCNSAEMESGLAVAGLGVTRLPAFACAQELAAGLLEPVLEPYERPPHGVYAVYPHRQHLSAKVRAFVDFLVARFGGD